MSLCKYQDMIITASDTAAYTQYLGPHRMLILTAFLLKISQINLKKICIQKMKNNFDQNYLKGPFCVTRLISTRNYLNHIKVIPSFGLLVFWL